MRSHSVVAEPNYASLQRINKESGNVFTLQASSYDLFIKSFHYKAYFKHVMQFLASKTSPALCLFANTLDLNLGLQSHLILVGSSSAKMSCELNVLRQRQKTVLEDRSS